VVCERWWREHHKEKQEGKNKIKNPLNPENLKDLINVGNALENFYEEISDEASKTRIYEGDIRIWCEKINNFY
jgi:hypothetical protein